MSVSSIHSHGSRPLRQELGGHLVPGRRQMRSCAERLETGPPEPWWPGSASTPEHRVHELRADIAAVHPAEAHPARRNHPRSPAQGPQAQGPQTVTLKTTTFVSAPTVAHRMVNVPAVTPCADPPKEL